MTRFLAMAAVLTCACEVSFPDTNRSDPRASGPAREGAAGGVGGGFIATGGFSGASGGFSGETGGFSAGGGFEAEGCLTSAEGAAPLIPASQPPPLSGGTMAALRDGSLVIADPDRSAIWLVSADLLTARQLPLAPSDEPGRVVEGAAGRAYVVLRRANAIAEVDVAAGTLRRMPTCELPRALAFRSLDSRLIVGCMGGALEQLEPVSGDRSLVTSTSLPDVRDVVVDGANLIVTQLRSAAVSRVTTNGTVQPISTSAVQDSEPRVAWRATARPNGGALVSRQRHRSTTIHTVFCGGYGGVQGVSEPIVTTELLSITGAQAATLGATPTRPVLPVDVAVSAGGTIGLVSAGDNTIILSTQSGEHTVELGSASSDEQPTSIVFVGEAAIVFLRQPARVVRLQADGTIVRSLTLSAPSVASTGHQLFHRATRSGLACASCHPEGGEDGHTWLFDAGARRTPTLRGGLTGTAPFHWAGDLPTMASLMSEVMVSRMQGPTESPERIDALTAWLDAVPALHAPSVDEAAAARGATLFNSAETGCSTCHSGPQGTNNQTVDVQTGGALQVPRLAEFAWRAPWFHDGRMRALSDRFSPNAGAEAHGHVSQLTPSQRDDLLEYLKTR